ncbi:MAG: hypothetical protein Q4G02_00200 [bacterium]|nr:hypothetical protein [bacterium]
MKKFGKKLVLSLAVFALTAMAFGGQIQAADAKKSNTLNLSNLAPEGIDVASDASTLIPNVVTIIFIVAAALTFAYLIYGAIKWITSGGEKSKVEDARNKITSAIIGLLILAATWAIFQLVLTIAFGDTGLTVPTLSEPKANG